MTATAKKALDQVSKLRSQVSSLRAKAKDNVSDLSRPAAGLAGAALAGAVRGASLIAADGGVIVERKIGGVVPWDVVTSSALTIAGLFSDPTSGGRMLTHMGMGGLAGRVYMGVSDAVGQHRLGDAWTGGQPVEVTIPAETES